MSRWGAGELEMFDGVGDVEAFAVDLGGGQRFVQEIARRPDERSTATVFLVAWLLADQHHGRMGRAFAEHRLLGVAVQIATLAGPGGLGQLIEVVRLRHKGLRGGRHGCGVPAFTPADASAN